MQAAAVPSSAAAGTRGCMQDVVPAAAVTRSSRRRARFASHASASSGSEPGAGAAAPRRRVSEPPRPPPASPWPSRPSQHRPGSPARAAALEAVEIGWGVQHHECSAASSAAALLRARLAVGAHRLVQQPRWDAAAEAARAQAAAAKASLKSWMRSLADAANWAQLAAVMQSGGQLDARAVTACFTAAAHISRSQAGQLARASAGHEQQDSPALRALAAQQKQLAAAVRSAIAGPKPELVAEQPWSQAAVLERLLVPALQAKLAQLDGTGLVLILHSLAVLQHRSEPLLAELEQAVLPWLRQLSPRLVAQLLWSLGALQWQPQEQLWQAALVQSSRVLPYACDRDCSQLLQACARLQRLPPAAWAEACFAQLQQLCASQRLQPRCACGMLHSLGQLRLQPPRALLQQLLGVVQPHLAGLGPPGLNMLADGLRLLQADPGAAWQQAFLQASHAALPVADARNAPLLAAPLVRWRLHPGPAWCCAYLAASERELAGMSQQGLAVLGHSVVRLGLQPPYPWLQAYLAAAASARLACTPAGCSYLLPTLGAWQAAGAFCTQQQQQAHWPPDSQRCPMQQQAAGEAPASLAAAAEGLVRDCLRCFLQQGGSFSPEQLGMFCRGLVRLQLQGSPALSRKLNRVAYQQLSRHLRNPAHSGLAPSAATLANLATALALCCPAAASPGLLACFWAAAARLLPTFAPGQLAAVAWAAGRLGVHPSEAFVQQLGGWVLAEGEAASPQQLRVLWREARAGGWQLEPGTAQLLARHLLSKQASELEPHSRQALGRGVGRGSARAHSGALQQHRAAELLPA